MKTHAVKTFVLAAALVTLALAPGAAPALADGFPIKAVPIPSQSPAAEVPRFIGQPAVAHRVSAPAIPTNPWMGPAPWNNVHNDTYMSDTYPGSGPLGVSPSVVSTYLQRGLGPIALVAVMTVDQWGNLVAGAITSPDGVGSSMLRLTLLDPVTLDQLAAIDLPKEQLESQKARPSGDYFYSDQLGRTVIGTPERTIWIVSHRQTASGWEFTHDPADDVDLTSVIAAGDKIQSLQPDFKGRIWVTTKGGTVCTVDAQGGKVLGAADDIAVLGERIANSHAAGDEGGVYIASTKALYRFDADRFGRPEVTWRAVYGSGDRIKPGQVDVGTGTTPTLMGSKYVTISDNADPYMHVLVYKRAKRVSGKRLVAKVPVFKAYKGSNENSLVATDHSIIVENNYGYRDQQVDTTGGRTTLPGLARIDLDEHGRAHKVWTSYKVSIPSVISKLSLRNGLIYSYTKPAGPGTTDRWYFTAVDFRTGKTVWRQLAGTGFLYDNDYAGTYLGPTGTFYVGVNGGVVAMRDGQ